MDRGAVRAAGGNASRRSSAGPRHPTQARGAGARETPGVAVCRLVGDLDLTVVAQARARLEEALAARPSLLVVDLADVDFCDSSGLSLLLQIRLDAQARGVMLRLAALAAPVARVFEVTGTAGVFSIYATADEAARP